MPKTGKGLPVAVIGAGNGGLAFAAYMSLQGAEIRLYDHDADIIEPLKASRTIVLSDRDGTRPAALSAATTDPAAALAGARLIMVVTPASAHAAIAAVIAPHIDRDAAIILNPGRTGGALEVSKLLDMSCGSRKPVVAETQTLLFACRKTSGTGVTIKGIKKAVSLAALPANRTEQVVALLNAFFPQFVPALNVLETSLGNIGAIFHPTPTLLNVARIETTGGFDYYTEGISVRVARLLEIIDRERLGVAEALGVPAVSALDWLTEAYGLTGYTTLFDAIQNNPAYRGITAPKSIDVRYITEDVPTGLVPLANLARKAGVATPVIDTVINLACHMLGRNFWSEGRNLVRLGLDSISREDLHNAVT